MISNNYKENNDAVEIFVGNRFVNFMGLGGI